MMFSRAKNVVISGQPNFIYNDNRHHSGLGTGSLDEGIRLLLPRVVTGAMHNSGERFNAPTCHEETRIAIQEDILGWADELVDDFNEIVTCLYGPAGAGKSAISQTIAQKLQARGQLSASFFFSRASGGEGMAAETRFVATLAYQLSQSLPATRPYIDVAIRDNPLVFDLALRDQVDALIVAPLIAVSDMTSESERPRVIVVDGLDECRQENDAQKRIVDALISGLCQIPRQNHKLFITSRPDYRIVAIFKKYEDKVVRRMELNDAWKPDDDIRAFLNAGFADIRRSHFYFQNRHVVKWPIPNAIDALVHRSSGQFIYASVVLKYIKSDENYSPVARLQCILSQVKNNDDRPYAELDALYHYIFSQIRSVENVLTILSLWLLNQKFGPVPDFGIFVSKFMGVHLDEIKFRLLPLVSLLVWQEESTGSYGAGQIRYMHASLPDFLCDHSRSTIFYINTSSIVTGIVRRAIELLQGGAMLEPPFPPHSIALLVSIPAFYTGVLPSDQKHQIYSILTDLNLPETVLCKIELNHSHSYLMIRALVSHVNWVLEESKDKDASHHLFRFVTRIRAWMVNQLERLEFSGSHSDNTGQIDIWPFFMTDARRWGEIILKSSGTVAFTISLAHEICRPSPSYNPWRYTQETQVQISDQMVFTCYLAPHLPVWLEEDSLLDRYTMTSERYGVALQRTTYYLLQLSRQLLATLWKDPSRKPRMHGFALPILDLIRSVLPAFLTCSPRTPDLYFLVALTYPVITSIDIYRDRFFNTRASIYLHQAREEFSFLKDPTSSEYIQARAKVETACVQAKIKTTLHEMAEKGELYLYGANLLEYRELLAAFAVLDSRDPESG